jgi:hypothetical protein
VSHCCLGSSLRQQSSYPWTWDHKHAPPLPLIGWDEILELLSHAGLELWSSQSSCMGLHAWATMLSCVHTLLLTMITLMYAFMYSFFHIFLWNISRVRVTILSM